MPFFAGPLRKESAVSLPARLTVSDVLWLRLEAESKLGRADAALVPPLAQTRAPPITLSPYSGPERNLYPFGTSPLPAPRRQDSVEGW